MPVTNGRQIAREITGGDFTVRVKGNAGSGVAVLPLRQVKLIQRHDISILSIASGDQHLRVTGPKRTRIGLDAGKNKGIFACSRIGIGHGISIQQHGIDIGAAVILEEIKRIKIE